jgi:hypothetical protein
VAVVPQVLIDPCLATAAKGTMFVEIEERPRTIKKRKVHPEEMQDAINRPSCGEGTSSRIVNNVHHLFASDSAPKYTMQSIASALLIKREKALSERETELNAKVAIVEDRLLHVMKKEEELECRVAQDILAQLEENFACSLCYEIM